MLSSKPCIIPLFASVATAAFAHSGTCSESLNASLLSPLIPEILPIIVKASARVIVLSGSKYAVSPLSSERPEIYPSFDIALT